MLAARARRHHAHKHNVDTSGILEEGSVAASHEQAVAKSKERLKERKQREERLKAEEQERLVQELEQQKRTREEMRKLHEDEIKPLALKGRPPKSPKRGASSDAKSPAMKEVMLIEAPAAAESPSGSAPSSRPGSSSISTRSKAVLALVTGSGRKQVGDLAMGEDGRRSSPSSVFLATVAANRMQSGVREGRPPPPLHAGPSPNTPSAPEATSTLAPAADGWTERARPVRPPPPSPPQTLAGSLSPRNGRNLKPAAASGASSLTSSPASTPPSSLPSTPVISHRKTPELSSRDSSAPGTPLSGTSPRAARSRAASISANSTPAPSFKRRATPQTKQSWTPAKQKAFETSLSATRNLGDDERWKKMAQLTGMSERECQQRLKEMNEELSIQNARRTSTSTE